MQIFKEQLRIGSWNIHGVYDYTNNFPINKLESQTFLNILRVHDILCLQETHLGPHELPVDHLTDFKAIPHCRAISANGRYFGGMLLLVRKSVRDGLKLTNTENRDILGVTLKHSFFQTPQDRKIWFTYAPPLNSPYLKDKEGVLGSLESYLVTHNGMENTLVLGDLNGRTAEAADFALDSEDKHSPIADIQDYRHDTPSSRQNTDPHPVDKQGKYILDVCKSFNLRILNGRTAGDRFGRVTRYPINRTEKPSAIDYAIASDDMLQFVRSFIVLPFSDISDHCCISINMFATVNCPGTLQPIEPELIPPTRPPFQAAYLGLYHQNLLTDARFQELEEKIRRKLTTITEDPTNGDIEEWTDEFNQHITENAVKSFPSKECKNRQKRTKKTCSKPARWYTNACRATKKLMQRTANKLNKNPFDRQLQQQFVTSRKEYKKTCREAEKQARNKLLSKLLEVEANDPKEFWKILNSMRQWGKEKPDPSDSIPPDKWSTYFNQLLNTNKSQKFKLDDQLPFDPELDGRITLEELKIRLKLSKDGKAFGPDKTLMEYVKYAPENVLKTLLALMNVIFTNSRYPSQWCTNYLKILYKKGDIEDPNNYRGLSIGSCIGKLYSSILLGRLENFATKHKIIPAQQIGFKRGFRTADHVYLLKTLIDQTFHKKGKLYAAFIDFKKAYDTVNREKLLKKLQEIGLSGTFLRNIKALYTKTEYQIKLKKRLLKTISSNLGLKQGCPLSPILFNIYISDLEPYLRDPKSDITLHNTSISHFLYADDLVIVANSKEGLQKKLNGLGLFAKDKELTVNKKKSQIMIFNKAGRKGKENFTLDGTKLELVQTYTYLGVEMSSSGSFSTAIREINNKARKALIPLIKTAAQFRIPFERTLKLFKTYVEPILLYNAENWTAFTNKDISRSKENRKYIHENSLRAPITTSQLKFFKYALGVGRQSPNLAVLGEIAEIPLYHKAILTMLKYWNRIRDMDEDTLIKKAYLVNLNLNSNWCQTIQTLNATLVLNQNNPKEHEYSHLAKTQVWDSFSTYWREEIDKQPPRLKFYAQNKTLFERSKYLDTLRFKDRQPITKLLCSNHKLEVETGRHRNIERELRTCKVCTLGLIEDEDHFLKICPAYNEIRKKTIPRITRSIFEHDPKNIAQFVCEANDLREESLAPWAATQVSLDNMRLTLTKIRGKSKPNKPLPLQVTNRTDNGLKFTIRRQKLRKTDP